MTARVPVFQPLLEEEELAACVAALRNGWLGMGEFVGRFEEELRILVDAADREVVAVSTGHAALHLALLLAGVGPGDEVITPSFNNIADHQAILACGADVVFCDIRDDTLCIDVEDAERLVSDRTKVVISMDYGSHLCDHDAVAAFASRCGLRVVHDGAHSIGSSYKGKAVGSFSDITMFSFDPVKTITCIDGGALVVQTKEELQALQEMRLIGMGQPADIMYRNQRAWTYDVSRIGFRYHLANLHGALGLAQLKKFDMIRKNRQSYFQHYEDQFADLPHIRTPGPISPEITPFLYYVRVPSERRDEFREHLGRHGVDTGIHWQPGHWFSLFQRCRRRDLTTTERVGSEIVTLPLHSAMTASTLEQVTSAVRSFPEST